MSFYREFQGKLHDLFVKAKHVKSKSKVLRLPFSPSLSLSRERERVTSVSTVLVAPVAKYRRQAL